jgi:hypothetical protein
MKRHRELGGIRRGRQPKWLTGSERQMKATVVKLNLYLPSCEARTRNDIIIAFRPPVDGSIRLSDELEFDLERIDTEQDVMNFRTGQTIRLKVEKQNVHDVRLPGGHGTSRFPALDRRRGN